MKTQFWTKLVKIKFHEDSTTEINDGEEVYTKVELVKEEYNDIKLIILECLNVMKFEQS